MIAKTLPGGLEVRMYPNVVEYWQNGVKVLALTPAEYGEIHRWMDGELRGLAASGLWGP